MVTSQPNLRNKKILCMHITVFNTPIVTTVLATITRLIVKVCGWTLEGHKPCCRCIMIGSRHNNIWDYFIFMAVALNMRSPVRWLGKSSLFWGPFGYIMRYFGGIPVQRQQSDKLVSKAVSAFSCHDRFVLAMRPENPLSNTAPWKTEFWQIANAARVPIVPGYIDYKRKVAGVSPAFRTTGNLEQDILSLQTFYASCRRHSSPTTTATTSIKIQSS